MSSWQRAVAELKKLKIRSFRPDQICCSAVLRLVRAFLVDTEAIAACAGGASLILKLCARRRPLDGGLGHLRKQLRLKSRSLGPRRYARGRGGAQRKDLRRGHQRLRKGAS